MAKSPKTAAPSATETIDLLDPLAPPVPPAIDPNVIDCSAGPAWMVAGARVAKIIIRVPTFVEFIDCLRRGSGPKQTTSLRRRLQVQAYSDKGARLEVDELAMLAMPRQYAVAVHELIRSSGANEPDGEVLSAGDGIVSPAHVRLGTPILAQQSDGSKAEIIELEFMAKTLADIEDVLAEPEGFSGARAEAFIRRCAKPIGVGIDDLRLLPTWAVERISMSDGLMIMKDVMPLFLEVPKA